MQVWDQARAAAVPAHPQESPVPPLRPEGQVEFSSRSAEGAASLGRARVPSSAVEPAAWCLVPEPDEPWRAFSGIPSRPYCLCRLRSGSVSENASGTNRSRSEQRRPSARPDLGSPDPCRHPPAQGRTCCDRDRARPIDSKRGLNHHDHRISTVAVTHGLHLEGDRLIRSLQQILRQLSKIVAIELEALRE